MNPRRFRAEIFLPPSTVTAQFSDQSQTDHNQAALLYKRVAATASLDMGASSSRLLDPIATQCSTCGAVTDELACCLKTGLWFCNGRTDQEQSSTCIINHLTEGGYHSISLHPLSHRGQQLGDASSTLRCVATSTTNVFQLGGAMRNKTELVVISSRAARSLCPGYKWYPLVISYDNIPYSFSPWLLQCSNVAVSLAAQTGARRRQQLTTRLTAPVEYDDPVAYYRTFSRLVALLAAYDAEQSQSDLLTNVTIVWGDGLGEEPVAYFDASRVRSADAFTHWERVIIRRVADDSEPLELRGLVVYSMGDRVGVSIVSGAADVDFDVTLGYSIRKERVAISYDRMQTAALLFASDDEAVGAHLQQQILRPSAAVFPFQRVHMPLTLTLASGGAVNAAQAAAVTAALTRPYTIVKGPPGTGKTVTATLIVDKLARQGRGPVLVCAPSNVAATNDAEACLLYGLKTIRYFPVTRDEQVLAPHLSAELKIGHHTIMSDELKKLLDLYGLVALNVMHRARLKELQRIAYVNALRSVDVICCTCSAAGDNLLSSLRFDSCVVDEAAQAMEPEVLIPAVLGIQRLVLIGDECQLRPVVLCKPAARGGLEYSLFERSIVAGVEPVILREQYRMHPAISSFPSAHFYEGLVSDGPSTTDRFRPDVIFSWPVRERPLLFWHRREGEGVESTEHSQTGSYSNRCEARSVAEAVVAFLRGGAERKEITVIAMYDAQRQLIRDTLVSIDPTLSDVSVANVDAIQGHERAFVILSTVRSNDSRRVGFVADARRACVALTRAKSGLVVVGDAVTMQGSDTWRGLISHCVLHGQLMAGPLDGLRPYAVSAAAAQVDETSCLRDLTDLFPTDTLSNVLPGMDGAAARVKSCPEGLRATRPEGFVALEDTSTARRGQARRARRQTATLERSTIRPFIATLVASVDSTVESDTTALPLHLGSSFTASDDTAWFQQSRDRTLAEVCKAEQLRWCAHFDDSVDYRPHTDPSHVALFHHANSTRQCYRAEVQIAFRLDACLRLSAVALGAVRLVQYWWYARVIGHIAANEAPLYWRLANSRAPGAFGKLRLFIQHHKFASSPSLCEKYGVVLNSRDVLRGFVPFFRFRLVRRMRCNYGSMACKHAVLDADGKTVRDSEGRVVRRRCMATEADFQFYRRSVAAVTSWYQQHASAVQTYVDSALFVLRFFAPGGHAEGVRQIGYNAVGIDNSESLDDPQRWFETMVPELFPGSPIITVNRGNALKANVVEAAVRAHPTHHTVVASYDSPECDPYSLIANVGGKTRVGGAPARRGADGLGTGRENLSETVYKRQAEYEAHQIAYLIENAGNAAFGPPAGVGCTIFSGIMCGLRTHDRHKFYHPAELPLLVDAPLREAGRWLDARTCAGASRSLPPRHAHGSPVKPFCCPGQVASLVGNGYFAYSREALCKILGIHPRHVTTKPRMNDLLPPPMAKHSAAVLSLWVAQIFLHVPAFSYDQVFGDHRLALWTALVLRRGGSRAFPHLARGELQIVLVAMPANVPDTVLVEDRVGSVACVPVFRVRNRGLILELIASACSQRYNNSGVMAHGLTFVCDFLDVDPPTLVFATDSFLCNDAHHLVRRPLDERGVLVDGGGEPRGAVVTTTPDIAIAIACGECHDSEATTATALVGVSLSDYVRVLNGVDGASTVARAGVANALLVLPNRAITAADSQRLLKLTAPQFTPSIQLETSQVHAMDSFLRTGHSGDALPVVDANQIKRTLAYSASSVSKVDAALADTQLVAHDRLLAKAALVQPATALANSATPIPDGSVLRMQYEAACKELGVKLAKQKAGRVGGGGPPRANVVTVTCAAVFWNGHVVCYARSQRRLCLFSGPSRRVTALPENFRLHWCHRSQAPCGDQTRFSYRAFRHNSRSGPFDFLQSELSDRPSGTPWRVAR
ncbi:AAA domain-containing protein [bacterium]|nr:AAA domain-containing protein [bacterium]